ncbi:TetR/AcrR family transcriptional regulator [Nocardia huaxiensis]|uniref:WHG domain-containing protein n=1 Tax=Nocardia huaxiensis TaxID=2755382 RepID=A0A7D6VJ07_9NOCA|nr:TetR/AcrR family transcriptional regulator [Nocardia huaxiensis]QLY30670.1 WHG domain-containing protein [Nocardia huaxiensis]UFS94161.1 TetR/AcrR family transcriptional regulator [Nocardia huaxiensis]
MSASSLRARVRTEMVEEIKSTARKRLAVDGANLSLRGVARDMGIVASALYRYFPSRDDLLTALILDAYRSLGAAATSAAAAAPDSDDRTKWLAACTAVRDWALTHPTEYGLLYGNPVPGYAAPQDTIAPASAVVLLLADIATTASTAGRLDPPPLTTPLPAPVRTDLRTLIDQRAAINPHTADLPEEVLDRVFAAWTQLFGLISFEIFGRLEGTIESRTDYFTHHMTLMADLVGLRDRTH